MSSVPTASSSKARPVVGVARLSAVSKRPAHPFSRELLLGWCLWLLACWFISGWVDGSHALPRLRTTQLMAWLGVMLLWPAWRLSIPVGPIPGVSTLGDMFSLWIGYQVLAARMLIDFPHTWRGPLINLLFTTWLLGAGLLVYLGRRRGPAGRAGFMALCIVIAFGGTLASFWVEPTAWSLALAPPRLMWLLSSGLSPIAFPALAWALGIIAAGWVALWIIALLIVARSGHAATDPPSDAPTDARNDAPAHASGANRSE